VLGGTAPGIQVRGANAFGVRPSGARLEPDPGNVVTLTTDGAGLATVRFETGTDAQTGYQVEFCGQASCTGVAPQTVTIDVALRGIFAACRSDVDFVDGSIFGAGEMYLTLGRLRDSAPYTSDYTWLKIYFRSLRERRQDFLSIRDYIWRWDTDWFWCSRNLYVQNLPMRLLLGRRLLNSVTYQKIMRLNNRIGLTATLNRALGRRPESVIQDVDIPLENAPAFARFFFDEIGIRPVWMCPIGGHDPGRRYPLYPLHGSGLYVNFGFWDVVPNPSRHPPGHFNRLVEARVAELGGVKSLYSDAYYDEETFWQLYDGEQYFALKRRYDPGQRLKNLYQKCVLKK